MRLLEAFEEFLRHLEYGRHCSPNTVVAYRSDLLQFMAWLDREMAIENAEQRGRKVLRPNQLGFLTAERVEGWQASLSLERRNDVVTVRRKLHTLRSFTKFCVRTGALTQDPLAAVDVPRRPRRVRRGLSQETYGALLRLDLEPRPVEATVRDVLALAGLRREEMATLTVGACLLSDRPPRLLIRGKGDAERYVPVCPRLRARLVDHMTRTGKLGLRETLFPTAKSWLWRRVRAWGTAVGVPGLHPHLFRHAWATSLILAGIKLDTVQEWLGHADLSTTALYLHTVQSRDTREAFSAWSAGVEPRGYLTSGDAISAKAELSALDEIFPA